MDPHPDVAVVGAGIVGLATAYRLLAQRPELAVTVLDKEDRVAAHQSSRNSGVLHAGLYYAPGSLRARLCTSGKRELEAFADQHGIPYRHDGKVVVAVGRDELPRLDALEQRALANRVEGLRRIGREELAELEPHAAGIAALQSPRTGVIDFVRVCEALVAEIEARGGRVLTGHEVVDLVEGPSETVVRTSRGDLGAGVVLVCGGLQSDRLAAMTGDAGDERIVPFRGSFLRLRPQASHLVRGSVYPVPDPRYPFLGVHATRRIDGEVWVGPNAVLALGRERYDRGVHWPDVRDALGFGGLWRLALRNVRAGATELWDDRVQRAYVRKLRRYLPEVTDDDVEPGPCGIRAQAVRRDGRLVDDFSIGGRDRVVHVRNAPSPAATAALAIGRVLAREVLERLGARSA